MKIFLLVLVIIFLAGCEISQVEYMNEESDNIISEVIEDVITEEEKEYSKKNEEIIFNSLYKQEADRNQYDHGEYLRLGDSMNMYINTADGEEELLQEVSVEDYFIIEVDDPEMEENRVDLYFILKLEEFPVENSQFGSRAIEVDSTLFFEDVNLGNYYAYGTEDRMEGFRRFKSSVNYNGEEKYSCNLSPKAEYEGDKRICTIGFSYAGPGEYLLVLSDKVGGFKNYLIEVE